MSKYLACMFAGALLVGIVIEVNTDGEQAVAWAPLMLAFMVATTQAAIVGAWSGQARDWAIANEVDARIDRFTDIAETLDGQPLCEVELTVHSPDFTAYRTTAVTLRDIRSRREVGDELNVVRPSPDHPNVHIVRLDHRVHEFGPDSFAPRRSTVRYNPPVPRELIPVIGESSRPLRSSVRSMLVSAACVAAFVLGAAGWAAMDGGSVLGQDDPASLSWHYDQGNGARK